jgi:hypothetical protein
MRGRGGTAAALACAAALSAPAAADGETNREILIRGATVVTMDANHIVIKHGRALMTDAQFRNLLIGFFGTDAGGRLNIEAIALKPPIDRDDDFLRALLNGRLRDGLIDDATPRSASTRRTSIRSDPAATRWRDFPRRIHV